jgi:hypothetical protein
MPRAFDICPEIHRLFEVLPTYNDPSEIPFDNGLCLFYEKGEVTEHAPNGRIVRVENHKPSESLKSRLALDYSGDKNSSEFRKLLGGALLIKMDPDPIHFGDYRECLGTEPWNGHWAREELACDKCRPIEAVVSYLLRSNFLFRCIEIEDQKLRNIFERKLIATISLCPCPGKPSKSWLGRFSYASANWGLWNVEYGVGEGFLSRGLLNKEEFKILENIVTSTLKNKK